MFLPPRATVIFFILLAVTIPEAVDSLSYSQYKTLVSLSQSLLTRVSNLRSARGDADGSNRARLIAEKLERWQGVGFWGAAWSVGRDYIWNYAWGSDLDYAEIFGVASDLNQLGRMLGELTRSNSDMERASWVAGNYRNALAISKRIFNRLLKVFKKSGALREITETMQREVLEGGLLRDCMELGSNDLKGLIQIFKDLASQYSTSNHSQEL
ncbi:adenine phosphoribosyltransferase [Gossypium australe]|uniref:Adenine phosphoribosyltransferase n=1 Tax=Gossypium australe TaxID=47621 RepID=A0A5B6XBS5_9ROSI|nr:adenine phosphoribosyltransferase [Gossypium australe]